jgi:uncharacterized protein
MTAETGATGIQLKDAKDPATGESKTTWGDKAVRRRKRNFALRAAGASVKRGPRSAPGERAARLWAKAQVAAQSARLLIETGDSDGAVNRAYYAVFGAARAALAAVRSSLAVSKRHGTIYRRFDKHLVQERGFDPSLGRRFLSKQRRARQAADYEEGRVDETVARAALGDMDRFLAAVAPLLKTVKQ